MVAPEDPPGFVLRTEAQKATPPTASDDAMGLGYASESFCVLEQNAP